MGGCKHHDTQRKLLVDDWLDQDVARSERGDHPVDLNEVGNIYLSRLKGLKALQHQCILR
ncbi:hypothetical protein SDC9_159399 [bioreactor metagenome]|uniref:Uncharacterized protein n=1 Tax=bioreactor metagenome TaxID=1076179 RepID=A0A645FFG6_9ZZZZ